MKKTLENEKYYIYDGARNIDNKTNFQNYLKKH